MVIRTNLTNVSVISEILIGSFQINGHPELIWKIWSETFGSIAKPFSRFPLQSFLQKGFSLQSGLNSKPFFFKSDNLKI